MAMRRVSDDDIRPILEFTNRGVHEGTDLQKLFSLMDQYNEYKRKFGKHLKFDPKRLNLSKYFLLYIVNFIKKTF